MAVKRLLNIRPQYDDGNGALASNYRLFFYAAGSSTKQNTYSSSAGTSANSNPITLNALGEPAVEIWGTVGQTYKIGLAIAGTDDPPASFIWTEDNISPINDTSVSIDEWVSGPTPTFVSTTQFTLSGDQTSTFAVGRRVKTTNTAGTVYGRITASAFGALTTITLQCDGTQVLDSGLSAVSYGLQASLVKSSPERIATTSGTDTYTATVGISRLVIGDEFKVKIGTTSTSTTPTLNLDSTGAKTVIRGDGTALLAGDLSGEHTFRWNGTNMIVLNPTQVKRAAISETQSANVVFAGPASGGAAAPTFRAIVAADIYGSNFASPITNSIAGDVALNNTGLSFIGPTVAQGTSGTWFACGTVTVKDTAGAADFKVFLTDGTNVIASGVVSSGGSGFKVTVTLSGYIASPLGNIRMTVNDITSTSGKIVANDSGSSKDSTLTAIRIA